MKDLRHAGEAATHGSARLHADVGAGLGAFAVRIPAPGLTNAGFTAGGWLVLRPVVLKDLGPDTWIVVVKARGKFVATGANWTIAHVKELPGDDATPPRLQVSYGSATGKEFRPERIDRVELTLAATVLSHADEAM
jgi:hypothetical protein